MHEQTSLDPALAAVLAELKGLGYVSPDPVSVPLDVAREQLRRQYAYLSRNPPPMARTQELRVTCRDRVVQCKVHFPAEGSAVPLIVYLHGGGWMFGGIETHDRIMRAVAVASGMAVAGVDYTLAPDAKYPDQLAEVGQAVATLRANARGLGIDPRRVLLLGDSAGANLALAAALHWLDPESQASLLGLILFYGVYAAGCDSASWRAFGDGRYGLSARSMEFYWSQYLPAPEARTEPPASPLSGRLDGLPPVWLGVGDLDPLLDDSRMLAERLQRKGTPCRLRIFPGYPHAFLRHVERVEGVAQAIAEAGQAAREIVAGAWT